MKGDEGVIHEVGRDSECGECCGGGGVGDGEVGYVHFGATVTEKIIARQNWRVRCFHERWRGYRSLRSSSPNKLGLVLIATNVLRSQGVRKFAFGMVEVASITLPGFLLRFPCHVQRKSFAMENSSDLSGSILGSSLVQAYREEAMMVCFPGSRFAGQKRRNSVL